MKVGKKWLIVGAIAVLLLGLAATALAQELPRSLQGGEEHSASPLLLRRGRVEAKSNNGFTLNTRQGEITVSVAADTRYRIPGLEQPTLDDIQVGDEVLVLGRMDEAGTLLARMVTVIPPVPVGGFKGEVTAIEGQTLTVATPVGDKQLRTDEHTRFRVPDVEQATLADIQVGNKVFVVAEASEGEMLLAKLVAVVPDDALGPVSLRGRVTNVTTDSLAVQVRENVATVTITATTQIRVPGVENASLSDVHTGDWVFVVGRPAGLCRVEAKAIAVLPPISLQRFAVRGEVQAIAGTSLTVESNEGTRLILTDDQTRFRVPGVEEASITDIHIGDQVLALGKPAEDDTILARLIVVRHVPEPQPGETEAGAHSVAPPQF